MKGHKKLQEGYKLVSILSVQHVKEIQMGAQGLLGKTLTYKRPALVKKFRCRYPTSHTEEQVWYFFDGHSKKYSHVHTLEHNTK